jgi:methionyl aminopeptidase
MYFRPRPGILRSSLFFRKRATAPSIKSNFIHQLKQPVESEQCEDEFGLYDIILPSEPYVYGTKWMKSRTVPDHILRPPYAMKPAQKEEKHTGEPPGPHFKIVEGSESETRLREAAKLAKKVKEYAGSLVQVLPFSLTLFYFCIDLCLLLCSQVGRTTNEIDSAVHDYIVSHNAYPSPLLYQDFPKSICTRYSPL